MFAPRENFGWELPPGVSQADIDDPEPDDEWERECEEADEREDDDLLPAE